MWRPRVGLWIGATVALLGPGASARAADCAPEGAATRCIYRSLLPSSGLVSVCKSERDCRVGYYAGNPSDATWLVPPPALGTLPQPQVTWLTATLAEVRLDCGHPCSVSYFFEAQRRQLSEPRWSVVAVDARRWLVAVAKDRALVVRQLFSGREVTRIERDWAPGAPIVDAITEAHFGADGRLSFTWLRGAERTAVSERMSVPSFARP